VTGRLAIATLVLAVLGAVMHTASAASDPRSTYAGTRLTAKQAMQYAYKAGFHTQKQLVTVTAIGIAESGLVTKTRNWHPEFGYRPASNVIGVRGPGSVWNGNRQMHSDRGVWQISSHFWSKYSDAQTDNPASAAKIMFAISRHGTDFSPWNTFTGGDFSAYANGSNNGWPALGPIARQVIAAGGGGVPHVTPVKPAAQPKAQPAAKPKAAPAAKPVAQPAAKPSTSGSEVRMSGTYITAYVFHDNNHPGPATISHPVIHRYAGGTGTFADPITVAVANGSNGGLQFAAGTKFYIPNLRAYFIAEDTIGESSGGRVHLDVWAGGRSSSHSSADRCANHVTGNYLVIRNPARNHAVVSGPLSAGNRCRRLYGDTVRTRGAHSTRPPQPFAKSAPKPVPAVPVAQAPIVSAPALPSQDGDRSPEQHWHHRHYARWSSLTYCHH
jgi:hypothetical protein